LGQQAGRAFAKTGRAACDDENIVFDLHKRLSIDRRPHLHAGHSKIMAVTACHNPLNPD
jgi:hypothetical protein